MVGNVNKFGNIIPQNGQNRFNAVKDGKDGKGGHKFDYEFKKPDVRDVINTDKFVKNHVEETKSKDGMSVSDKKNQDSPVLSEAAQKLLEELRKNFGNVDFIVASFSTDEEAQRYLKTGKGEYNCVITPALLEKMAADEEVRAKYENVIKDAIGDIKEIKEKVQPEAAEAVKNYGVSVNSDGEVTYYAILKNGLPDSLYEGLNGKTVKASTVEQLLKLLDEIAEKIKKEKELKPPDDDIAVETETTEKPENSEQSNAQMDFTA